MGLNVVFRVNLGRFAGMVFGVNVVSVRHGRVVGCLVVFAGLVLRSRVLVMFGGFRVMLRGLLVMVGAGMFCHRITQLLKR